MPEPSSIAYALTYVRTLGLAFLLFLSQLVAGGILLALTGLARIITVLVRQGVTGYHVGTRQGRDFHDGPPA